MLNESMKMSATGVATAETYAERGELTRNPKLGVLLLNFGGPWTLKEVKPFLYRLFVNPSVLVGVPTPLRQLLAFTIAQVKGPSSVKSYKLIGGGSPQLCWTERQAEGLRRLFPTGQGGRIRVEVGMRSAEPTIERALAELRGWGAEQLVLLPLFPQFSTTTTGTCFQEVKDALRRLGWQPPVREVANWPDHPAYIALLRRTVDEAVAQAEAERGDAADPVHVLFSAHSLPMKIVRRGDPYQVDVERTIAAVTKDLRQPWSLCFQSRNGPVPWLKPYTEDEIKRLACEGVRRLVIVPLSFVSDHIETLYELDRLYADLARWHGVTHYYRARLQRRPRIPPRAARNFNGGSNVLGTLDTDRREATVVGAGIAGLLAAYALDRKGYRVTLLEAQARAGGLIGTRRTEYGIAETAAHSLLATPEIVEFCRELGIQLAEIRPESRARYVLRDGQLRKFPLRAGEALSAAGHAAFARAGNHLDALDLETWGRRHVGEAATQYLLTPLVRGIYGVRPAELGVAAAFPELALAPGQTLLGGMLGKAFKRPPQNGHTGRGTSNGHKPAKERKRMVAPSRGMGAVTESLERLLEQKLGARFQRGVRVDSLPDAPNVVLATPAAAAAALLHDEAPELSRRLRAVQYTPIVSVTAFVERASFTRPVSGVGVLVPAREERQCLGILFTSSAFPGRIFDETRHASFTVLLGGTSQPDWVAATDAEIGRAVRAELASLLGIEGEPLQLVTNRWSRAIPQYSTALPAVWRSARESWCAAPGRILFGNYTGQVSLRGMIEQATARW